MLKAPTLLIATPSLTRLRLERSLVLLTVYDEAGSLGFVVNRESGVAMSEGLRDLGVEVADGHQARVLDGGPSRRDTGWMLLDTRATELPANSMALSDGVAVTACPSVASDVVLAGSGCLAISGYVGWGPGELTRELDAGGWLACEVDAQVLFDTPSELRYARALELFGVPAGVLGDVSIASA